MLPGATESRWAWVPNVSIPALIFGDIVIWDELGNPRGSREAVDRAYAARAVRCLDAPDCSSAARIRLTSSPCQEARESVGRAENGRYAQPATRSRVFELAIDCEHGGGVETRAMRLEESRKNRV